MRMQSLSLVILVSALCACGERAATTPTAEAPPPASAPAADPPVDPAMPPPAGACDRSKAAWAVGQAGSDDILERARLDAGAETARFLRPGQAVTMEYNERRLNLEVDANNMVIAARCG